MRLGEMPCQNMAASSVEIAHPSLLIWRAARSVVRTQSCQGERRPPRETRGIVQPIDELYGTLCGGPQLDGRIVVKRCHVSTKVCVRHGKATGSCSVPCFLVCRAIPLQLLPLYDKHLL